jgi:hypothetical protein
LATSYNALKTLDIFKEIKTINRAGVMESQLSCRERLDVMRMPVAAQAEADRIGSVSARRASESSPDIWSAEQPLFDLDFL